ncbi:MULTISPECIES: MFS transporter [unclassified Sphingobium]|uniref:MFS transporter n=1 Tax=unclassified Sphingobium TaxID=2611147 RepID=UPI0022257DD1|nr:MULTISPECIES: MFS transporter [unclassified Sphingobium]MCW2395946.1 MFS family permease [Sphingobium sp. B8D3B]MCW2419462.1 MFS family permease [Sphingobium sp. B8D3C]
MLAAIQPVRSLLLAIFMLMAGSGFLSTLISLRLERAGAGTIVIGVVATAYFAGLVVGALRAGEIVRRVGHIRAFAVFVSLLSASTLSYALIQSAPFWAGLRLIDGLCVAGVFICLESWLNDRAEMETRGSILAAYMVALYLGQAVGQLLLGASGTLPAAPFLLASILISLAIIPLCLTRSSAPTPVDAEAFTIRGLYAASPLGTVGAVATGLMLGAFYGMAAVHVRRLGLDLSATATFMMIVILGGVALQWPLGRLSDRLDRRRVIVGCFTATLVVSLMLAMLASRGLDLLVLGALFGGLSFALYPLCVAHCNDRLLAAERVAASGRLVLLYSAGAAAGPLGAALLMSAAPVGGLFFFIALCAGLTLAFGLWRQASTPPVPAPDQQDFQIVPRTTPMASLLDPNTVDGQTE